MVDSVRVNFHRNTLYRRYARESGPLNLEAAAHVDFVPTVAKPEPSETLISMHRGKDGSCELFDSAAEQLHDHSSRQDSGAPQ